MFEDSTFESTGRIRTRSRGWMMAAFVFNGSILLALILIPLIYPEALPRQMDEHSAGSAARAASAATQAGGAGDTSQAFHGAPEMDGRTLIAAPSDSPERSPCIRGPEAPAPVSFVAMDTGADLANGIREVFQDRPDAVVTPATPRGPVRLPSVLASGLLI